MRMILTAFLCLAPAAVQAADLIDMTDRFEAIDMALAAQIYGPRVPVGPQSSITCPAGSTNIAAGANIQQVVDGKPAGTSYCLAAGTYNQQSVVPKSGDSFTGAVGTILDGQKATKHAFSGNATNVLIQNLVVTNYATGGKCVDADHSGCQRAAIDNRSAFTGSYWTIKNVEVSKANGVAIMVQNNSTVMASSMHDNGQEGYSCGGANVVFVDNKIYNNNPTGAISWGWEGGGGKCWATQNLKFLNNEAYGNWGPGLWDDNDNEGTLYDGNFVHDNRYAGIFHEISWDATITNNRSWNNGINEPQCIDWIWCAQIIIAGSGGTNGKSIEIHNNDIKFNSSGNGIGLIQQARGNGKYGPYLVQHVHVSHNTIDYTDAGTSRLTGAVQDINNMTIFSPAADNTFDYDTFVGLAASTNGFTWANDRITLAGFQAHGQELHRPEPPQPQPPTIPSGALIIVPPPCPTGFQATGLSCLMVQP